MSEIKITMQEIDAVLNSPEIRPTKTNMITLSPRNIRWILHTALTVRKRLKKERKEAKRKTALAESAVTFADELSKHVADMPNPAWDGRLNVWIPWKAEPDSVCPVPDGGECKIASSSPMCDKSPDLAKHWDWTNKAGAIITAYMVTKAPPAKPEWDGKTFSPGEWEMRNGERVRSASLGAWTKRGRWLSDNEESDFDLIRPWQDKEG